MAVDGGRLVELDARGWRRLVRRLGGLPGLRNAKELPAVRRVARPLACSALVSRPATFAVCELARRGVTKRYRLRGSGLDVHLRHPHIDVWIFDEVFYRRVYEPPLAVRRVLESLGRPPRIADVGAHVGLAGAFFLGELPGSQVVAFEPEPGNAAILRRTIEANGLGDRWRLVEACVSNREEDVELVGSLHLARVGEPVPELPSVSLRTVDLFPFLDEVDLLKLDVQGAEWDILADPRFAELPLAAAVVEVHPLGAPGPDAAAEGARLLREAGFTVGPRDVQEAEATFWAWREPR